MDLYIFLGAATVVFSLSSGYLDRENPLFVLAGAMIFLFWPIFLIGLLIRELTGGSNGRR